MRCNSLLPSRKPNRHPGMASWADTVYAVILRILLTNAALWGSYRRARVHDVMQTLLPTGAFSQILRWPFARVADMSEAVARRNHLPLRAAYLYELIIQLKMWPDRLSPCECCSRPTGSWCEGCDTNDHAVCSACEDSQHFCHQCISPWLPSISRADGIYAYQPEGEVAAWDLQQPTQTNPYAEYVRGPRSW